MGVRVFCSIVSVGAIVAIAALLKANDRQPLSSWDFHVSVANGSFHLSLNSIVAILGTLCKSTIAVVLSSSLSQTKWNWFANKRQPLQDFEIFDSASRGPRGSIHLLWRTKARRLASLGAFLIILTLTFDPFLQLLITYTGNTQLIPDPSATIARAYGYFKGGEAVSGINHLGPDNITIFNGYYYSTDSNMISATNNALWNMETRLSPRYNCPSGNCTWPTYVSLAICSKCFDISNHLKKYFPKNVTYRISDPMSVPNGNLMYSLEPFIPLSILNSDWDYGSATGMNITGTSRPEATMNFQDTQTLLLSLASITTDHAFLAGNITWEDTRVRATECGLLLCSNTYSSVVEKRIFSETITSTRSERVPASWSNVETLYSHLTYIPNGTWNPIGPSIEYHVDRTDFEIELSPEQAEIAGVHALHIPQASLDSLYNYIWSAFTSPDSGGAYTAVELDEGLMSYGDPTIQALWSAPSINMSFSNLAVDMSAMMRDGGTGPKAGVDSLAFQPLTGFNHEYATIIVIHWPFIIVPVLICALAVIFFVAAIIQTKRTHMPLWKDSALAGLLWGLDDETRQVARDVWRLSGGKSRQATEVVYLGGNETGELVR